MSPLWGVHTGLQNTTVAELQDLWRRIEDHGFDWISIWDHFYAADLAGTHCLEAVAAHTALAMSTERVRVGALVYCAGYRHPAVLANAIATIDHFSGGRADIGLGRRVGQRRVPRLRHPLPQRRSPPRHPGGGGAVHPRSAPSGPDGLRRRAVHPDRRGL